MQIYKANFENGPKQGNPHAYEMWLNYPDYLIYYGCTHYDEWKWRLTYGLRGGKLEHKSGEEFTDLIFELPLGFDDIVKPPWLTEQFCSNHRSVMLGKVWENHNNICRKYYDTLCNKFVRVQDVTVPLGHYNNPQFKKITKKYDKAKRLLSWYQFFDWQEKPAQRVLIDGKMRWPYLWNNG